MRRVVRGRGARGFVEPIKHETRAFESLDDDETVFICRCKARLAIRREDFLYNIAQSEFRAGMFHQAHNSSKNTSPLLCMMRGSNETARTNQ